MIWHRYLRRAPALPAWITLVAIVGVACRRRTHHKEASAAPAPPVMTAPSPMRRDVRVPPDAAPPATVAATPSTDAGPPREAPSLVDLLRATEAAVAVSSVVDNANDRPDRLVDGDLATAWSSRTGEMERTWIEVRVPEDARVHHFELTAGYTRQTERRDLFTANVRIRRLRISRDGQALGEYDLDPAQRGLQIVPASGAGGRWRIELIGLVAGTRSAWREVTVSELRVMGVAGASGRRALPVAPAVTVGPSATAGAATAADGGDPSGVERALAEARVMLLEEGHNPEEGVSGCNEGPTLDAACARQQWIALAEAGVTYARRRCGPAVTAAASAYDRQARVVERAEARYERAFGRGGGRSTERADELADESVGALMDAAAQVFSACPSPGGLTEYGAILRQREHTQLHSYRFRP